MPFDLVSFSDISIPSVPNIPGLPSSIPNPFIPGSLPNLPFPIPGYDKVSKPIKDVLAAVAAAGLAPVVTGILASYLAYLEQQANGRLKSIPSELANWLAAHYNVDVGSVRYAENIDTVHGQGITVGSHIYFTKGVDLIGSRDDINWLFHELEHCVQYQTLGGVGPFMAKYAVQCAAEIISKKSFDVHDAVGIESEAISKAAAMDSIYPWGAGMPPVAFPPIHQPHDPGPAQTLKYTISITTADGIPSGTRSSIYLVLIGTRGSTQAIRVPPNGPLGGIVPGSTISISDSITGLGDLRFITLLSDGAGLVSPDWRPESVKVTVSNGQSWTVAVNRVIGGDHPLSVTMGV